MHTSSKNMRQGENKRSAFKRLATNRLNYTLKGIRLLGNLSNRNNYDYTEKDIKIIFGALEEELRLNKARFALTQNRKRRIRL